MVFVILLNLDSFLAGTVQSGAGCALDNFIAPPEVVREAPAGLRGSMKGRSGSIFHLRLSAGSRFSKPGC